MWWFDPLGDCNQANSRDELWVMAAADSFTPGGKKARLYCRLQSAPDTSLWSQSVHDNVILYICVSV